MGSSLSSQALYDNEDQLVKSFGNEKQFKNPIGTAYDDDYDIICS